MANSNHTSGLYYYMVHTTLHRPSGLLQCILVRFATSEQCRTFLQSVEEDTNLKQEYEHYIALAKDLLDTRRSITAYIIKVDDYLKSGSFVDPSKAAFPPDCYFRDDINYFFIKDPRGSLRPDSNHFIFLQFESFSQANFYFDTIEKMPELITEHIRDVGKAVESLSDKERAAVAIVGSYLRFHDSSFVASPLGTFPPNFFYRY